MFIVQVMVSDGVGIVVVVVVDVFDDRAICAWQVF